MPSTVLRAHGGSSGLVAPVKGLAPSAVTPWGIGDYVWQKMDCAVYTTSTHDAFKAKPDDTSDRRGWPFGLTVEGPVSPMAGPGFSLQLWLLLVQTLKGSGDG